MAATSAAVLSAAARRISRSAAVASSGGGTHLLSAATRRMSSSRSASSSSSSIITREVTGHHNLTISGYAATRKAPVEWIASSQAFDAAGYRWRIKYYPNGNSWNESNECISIFVELADDIKGPRQEVKDPVQFKLSLLDRAGNPSPKYCRSNDASFFVDGQARFQDFIRWKELEESGCLKDDSFIVRCDITVIKKWAEDDDTVSVDSASSRVVVPPSDLHRHLYDMLWKKQGVDVAIDVAGETFEAHGWLLAARSPAFEAELLAAPKEKAPGGGAVAVRRRVEIGGMEPRVFKALLHFMYTDALPPSMMEEEEEKHGAVAMARDLLAAAHRYELERLKLLCEEMLCRCIDVDTVAGTMAVAEQHGCGALEAACAEFLARPGNLKAVMETEGYEKIKANPTMMELIMKQLV
ncbi:BTB/POZ and MATH domain-containing protein 1-like [Miscanthus floridulus]|uniref:BTB/POZ and MATH domain-containing protein 1-like n=1 Tax=Miscanthus floridulus TaxID=154761 RepID=UPI0034580D35